MSSSQLFKEFIEGLMSYGMAELKREIERGARAKLLSTALHGIRAVRETCRMIVIVVAISVLVTYSAFSLGELYFSGALFNQGLLFFYLGIFIASGSGLVFSFREKFWLKAFKINQYMADLQKQSAEPSAGSFDKEAILLAIDKIVEVRLKEKLAHLAEQQRQQQREHEKETVAESKIAVAN